MEDQDKQNDYYLPPMPNGNVILSQEPVQLHIGDSDYEGSALTLLQLLPEPQVFISIELGAEELDINSFDIVSTTFQESKITTDILITTKKFSTNKLFHLKGILRNRLACSNDVSNLHLVTFYLCNFPDFLVYKSDRRSVDFELFCEADGWELKIVPVKNLREQIQTLVETGGYGFTHICRLKKIDDSKFSSQEINDLLTALFYFFSFARGFWCPPVLPVGRDEKGKVIWIEWGCRLSDRWSHNGHSWFDSHHAEALPEILPGFLKIWKDATWENTIRSVVYWYVKSNVRSAGIDGGIILAQTALELLSWVYNVNYKKGLSAEAFKRITASDQMRLMLVQLNIPVNVPEDLDNLKRLTKEFTKTKEAPEILTEIRNSIAHPTHKNKLAFKKAFYETWNLNLWYIEMVLLRLCGFVGHYGNRLTRRWLGQVVPVPWASKE